MSGTTVNQENFQTIVVESKKPVLIDFWAPWCGPCRMLTPIVEEIEKERPDIQVVKINVDEQPGLAADFKVMSIPTLVVMKDGEKKGTAVGVQSKEKIIEMLEK